MLVVLSGICTASLLTPPRVAVVGGTGKLGRQAVKQLVDAGYEVKALVRHDAATAVASDAPDATPAAVSAFLATLPGVTLVQGSVTSSSDCADLLEGCAACLALHGARRTSKWTDALPWTRPEDDDPSHAKQVNYMGVRYLLSAAAASKTCKRIVRVTGKGETPFSIFSVLINTLGSMAKAWNYEGERLLRGQSEVEYTIVRPGVMAPDTPVEPKSLVLADNGGDLKVSRVAHETIAALCVQSLEYPNAGRATLCAMTVPSGDGADSYAPLLANVGADSRAFAGDELFEKHLLAVRLAGTALAAAACAVAALALSVVSRLLSLLPFF